METSTYDWRLVHTSGYRTGDEYIRVPRGQETSTYECLEVRKRVHTTGDQYIRVPRDQETSTYRYIQVDISRYQYPKAGDQYILVGRPLQKVQIQQNVKKPVHKNPNVKNLAAEFLSHVPFKHYMFLQIRPSIT